MGIGYGIAKSGAINASDINNIQGPSGWYYIRMGDGSVHPLYIDQEYDGGGWVLIFQNNRYTSGMNNLSWRNAMDNVNYRWGGTDDATNNEGRMKGHTTLDKFNCWVGLNFLSELGGRKTTNRIEVVQYAADTKGVALSDTGNHRNRMTMHATGINPSTGGWQGAGGGFTAAGTDGTSGFYSYMTGGHSLTTYDKDLDTNGGNCSTYYNNNPYWYTSCWSGNLFAGGGYVDSMYWTSSSSGFSREFGAVYIK